MLKFISLRKLVKPAAVCISLLFIISTVSLFDIASVQGATSYTFGNTAVGTLTNSFGTDRDASRFQLTQNGVLQSINAYFANTGFNAKAAIYADNNGAPSTLITQSASQTVTVVGWQTFTVPASSLTAGYYWLCVVSSSYSKGAMTATSTNTHAWKTTSYSGEFVSTFGTPSGYEKTATSIYATYTTTTPLPNSTPTPTPTPSPNPTTTPSTSYTFGNTAVGTLTNSFGTDRDASRFQLTQNGVLQSINAYFANTGFNAKAAIYADNNGAPSTLITQSASQTVTVVGWQTFTVPASSLTAGYYWLCVVSSSYSKGAMTATSTNTHAWKTTSYSGEFVSTFGTPSGYEKTATSIYATYTTTTPLPNSTPTPTPTPSPNPTTTPSTSYTFGNTAVGTLTNSFGTDRDASRFQLTQNGVLQSINAYFANTGFNAKAAIYADNNGAPSTLITQSASQTVTVVGWQTFTVPASSLTAGYYWLCVVSSSYSKGAMTATSTNTHAWKTTSYSGEFVSTFGTPSGYEKTATSIYATYTTTTPLPNSTPTPTPTTAPTPTPYENSNQIRMLRYGLTGRSLTKTSAQYAASLDVMEGFYPWLSAIDGPKTYNPNLKIFMYFDVAGLDSTYCNELVTTCMNNNWLLKDSSGNYLRFGSNYMWDFGNPSARAYIANWLKQQIVAHPSLDGVRYDNCHPNTDMFYNLGFYPPINPRTGSAWTDQQVCDAIVALTNTIKSTTGKLVFANSIHNGNMFFGPHNSRWIQLLGCLDGVMGEQLFEYAPFASWSQWVPESYWKSSLDFIVWLQDNWMSGGDKYLITVAENAQADQPGLPSYLPTGATQQQFMTFQFASQLLGAEYNYPCMYASAYTFNADGFYQSLFSKNIAGNLGSPAGSYYIMSGTHLYARQFSTGMVIVNPTGSYYTATIGAGYENAIDGSATPSAITVQPHTGIILLKA
jgi:hypothetical protein